MPSIALARVLRCAAVVLLVGCPGGSEKPEDTSDTAYFPCPHDVASFCAYEFGGDCPTYEEAAAMTCDGYHFDPTGTSGTAPRTGDGSETCMYPSVGCHVDYDPNLETSLYFTSQGAGTLHMVHFTWTDDAVCAMNDVTLGDFIDCR
jgi:hypothetical protein